MPTRKPARMKPVKATKCACCGATEPADWYHPYALCVLVKMLGHKAARENFNEVIAWAAKRAVALRITELPRKRTR